MQLNALHIKTKFYYEISNQACKFTISSFPKDLQLELCICPVLAMAFLFLRLKNVFDFSQFPI